MLNLFLQLWGQAHYLTPTFIIEPFCTVETVKANAAPYCSDWIQACSSTGQSFRYSWGVMPSCCLKRRVK